MIKKDNIIFYSFIVAVLTFLLTTTKYLSLHDIIHIAGQMDVISYTEISKYSPFLPTDNEVIIKHIAQRFFIPYFAGLISFHLNLDLFTVYKILTYTFLVTFAFAITIYVNRSDFSLKEKILFFSLLFLNFPLKLHKKS